MDVNKYLNRINYTGNTDPNPENLLNLHKKHLFNVPFENLDIHGKKKIILNSELIEKKIIDDKRGGYCYELNGLFFLLLKQLGFNVKMISARVSSGNGNWGKEYDHLAILAEFDDLWLADVGFGDSFIEPLVIKPDVSQKNPNGWFIISGYENGYLKLSKSSDNKTFTDEYIFTLKERSWNEFEEMNSYHQTSPDSPFTKKKLCTIANENGRITLTDRKLILTENQSKSTIEVEGEEDFRSKLFEYFGIRV